VLPDPDVPGLDPGFAVPGFVDPPSGEVGGGVAPGFGFGLLGFEFGLVGSFGDVGAFVSGVRGLPGVAPGVEFPAPVGGAVVLPVGGCPVLPVGGAFGDVCPGVADPDCPLPADPVPPAGACCATTHVAQSKTTLSNIIFFETNFPDDIFEPPALSFPIFLFSKSC
jgi:hypothetical protein